MDLKWQKNNMYTMLFLVTFTINFNSLCVFSVERKNRMNEKWRNSGSRSSKILKGTGTKKLGLRGATPPKLIGFRSFVSNSLRTILLFSWFFFPFLGFTLPFFFLLGISEGEGHSLLKFLGGHVPHSSPMRRKEEEKLWCVAPNFEPGTSVPNYRSRRYASHGGYGIL